MTILDEPASAGYVGYLPTPYQEMIHQTKYSRWIEEEHRRETWAETVDRYMNFVQKHLIDKHQPLSQQDFNALGYAILNHEIAPSMRALMTAGEALERDNVAAYNCAYLHINRTHAFDEALYILCCGTGVGFSVERQFVNQLPEIPDGLYPNDTTIVVEDSKLGWAKAFRLLIGMLYAGEIPKWNLSKVRPAGSRLKTFGGRASGPGPLNDLFKYTVVTFKNATGRRLNSEECHGIMCKIGDIVVAGGVRRSALISLSNPSDDRMRKAKSGDWERLNPHYRLANNSAAWTEKPEMERFIEEWTALIQSKSGERGIFNREAAKKKVASIGRRDPNHDFGMNPCGEIILRDREFCNLTEIVVREEDDFESLAEKARLATILGTIQATFTDFRYLSRQWRQNCEEERLLGVSMTGIMDSPLLNGSSDEAELIGTLHALKHVCIDTNVEYAEKFDIEASAANTCVKPSGNGSQLFDSASGIHRRHAHFYIRRTRCNKTDPVGELMRRQGVPCEDDRMAAETTWIFSWPVKAPEGATVRHDATAVENLNHWALFSEHWCEHNPSITVEVRDDEWLEVGAWAYKNFDKLVGVTFLPAVDHVYQQAPYEEITEEEYEALKAEMPERINWALLREFEKEDMTESAKELACVGGSCEIA